MHRLDQLVDEAVVAYRQQLVAAAEAMSRAMDAVEFCAAERDVFALTRELASEITRSVVQAVCDDPLRRLQAMQRLVERAAARGIDVRVQRVRETAFRTSNGRSISVRAQYAASR